MKPKLTKKTYINEDTVKIVGGKKTEIGGNMCKYICVYMLVNMSNYLIRN